MNEKTHYRKAFDSPYLASADIVEPTVLTIKCVKLETDRTKKTKDLFNTAHFVEKEIRPGEKLKPMILNATNSKTMKGLTGSAFIDDWNNVRVTVYVDHNVKFAKEMVEGLRISSQPPAARVEVPPDLLAQAREAAMQGVSVYAEWWKNAGKQIRQILAGEHESMKQTAADADAARTVEMPAEVTQ